MASPELLDDLLVRDELLPAATAGLLDLLDHVAGRFEFFGHEFAEAAQLLFDVG